MHPSPSGTPCQMLLMQHAFWAPGLLRSYSLLVRTWGRWRKCASSLQLQTGSISPKSLPSQQDWILWRPLSHHGRHGDPAGVPQALCAHFITEQTPASGEMGSLTCSGCDLDRGARSPSRRQGPKQKKLRNPPRLSALALARLGSAYLLPTAVTQPLQEPMDIGKVWSGEQHPRSGKVKVCCPTAHATSASTASREGDKQGPHHLSRDHTSGDRVTRALNHLALGPLAHPGLTSFWKLIALLE